VTVPPLVIAATVDTVPGIARFQIVQTAPASLQVRLQPAANTDPQHLWERVRDALTRLLADRGLGHVTVQPAPEPPQRSPGGKYRTVIPLP